MRLSLTHRTKAATAKRTPGATRNIAQIHQNTLRDNPDRPYPCRHPPCKVGGRGLKIYELCSMYAPNHWRVVCGEKIRADQSIVGARDAHIHGPLFMQVYSCSSIHGRPWIAWASSIFALSIFCFLRPFNKALYDYTRKTCIR